MAIAELRERLDDFFADLQTAHQRYRSGQSDALPFGALYASFPHLTSLETYQAVREQSVNPSRTELSRSRLRALLAGVATAIEEAEGAAASEQLARFEAGARVEFGTESTGFFDALDRLTREDDRDRRTAIERGLGRELEGAQDLSLRRLEAAFHTAERLGASSYPALWDGLSGFSSAELLAEAERALQSSEDAYRDLLGHFCRRLDAKLKPLPHGAARRHDLSRISFAPWLLTHFGPGAVVDAVNRWLLELGLHPTAHKKIRLDTEARAEKHGRTSVAGVRVPEEIALSFAPGAGMAGARALLHAQGLAQSLAHTDGERPVEDRRLGDDSVRLGYGTLFAHLLTEERWLKRYLGLSTAEAREAARVAAFSELARMRALTAELGGTLELFSRGLGRFDPSLFAERMRVALWVTPTPGFALRDVAPQLGATRALRAFALEQVLHRALQERFDEDFFRNPEAARFLERLFSRGQVDDASALARELGGELSLEAAAARWVKVIAA